MTSFDPWSKISSERRRAHQSARFMRSAGLLAALVIMVILVRAPLSSVLWRVFPWLQDAQDSLSQTASYLSVPFGDNAVLRQQNEQLQAQLVRTQDALIDRDALYAENLELKSVLGRPHLGYDFIRAGVIAQPPQLPYDTLMVDAGEQDGVAIGDDVWIGDGGVIIGSVTAVYATTARVALFSSAGVTHEGFLQGSTPVTVNGDGAGSLSARVPSDVNVAVGDQVFFPGVMNGISEVVASIDAPDSSSFKTLYLHAPLNIFSIRSVNIQKK